MQKILFWFRRDLRLTDNRGLHEAASDGDVVPMFVVDPTHRSWPHACGDRLGFKLDAVGSLRSSIKNCGGTLLVRTGNPAEILPDLARNIGADAVYWNRAYEPYERDRDRRTTQSLEDAGVSVETFKDQVLFEQREILTGEGTPYQVFTYYAKKWRTRVSPDPVSRVTSFAGGDLPDPGPIPEPSDFGLVKRLDDISWTPTEEAARRRRDDFLVKKAPDYEQNRDYPAREGTSRLSPHLRFGLVSARETVKKAFERRSELPDEKREGVDTFIEELIWRDFYHQFLYNHPRVVSENFRTKYDEVAWERHPDWLAAWKNGETGFPLVDAAMRQLNETGWMHNRLRMIVAQFLTKHCLIHWKKGETYFMNRLIDGDTAANNGGWQWSASTGTDAAPYFRVFNPVSQSKEYDPEGRFIRSFCPELSELPDIAVHTPWRAGEEVLSEAGISPGSDYPEPILDHNERREHAIETFQAAAE